MSPPPDKQAYRPFPLLAQAIRNTSERMISEWRRRTLQIMPELSELSVKQFRDDVSLILGVMADALGSNDPPDLHRLVKTAPLHGFQRYSQDFDLTALFAEERVLRRVIVENVECELKRQCVPDEAAALHGMIDIMLQQGVLALVQKQEEELREAAESQLKYLSFLSHDLGNNIGVISINLEFVQKRLSSVPEMKDTVGFVAAAMETMQRTRDGMRRLLEHEQLRNSSAPPRASLVELRGVAEPIVLLASAEAAQKNVTVELDIHPGCIAETNADLASIVLQNLIGNAVKHTVGNAHTVGMVRVTAQCQDNPAASHAHPKPANVAKRLWNVRISDDGPGIAPEQLKGLFEAFKSTPRYGKTTIADDGGFGLGLAIAAQAARLLGTSIQVQSDMGRGSTFSFCVPIPDGLD